MASTGTPASALSDARWVVAAVIANAEAFARRTRPVFTELSGLSARAAAQELDRRGCATARGVKWSATLIVRTRKRLEASP
jgi:hypothetical protein